MQNIRNKINESLSVFVWSDEGGRQSLEDAITIDAETNARDKAIAFAATYANTSVEDAANAYDAWITTQEGQNA